MDTNDKDVRREHELAKDEANELRANNKERHDRSTRKTNKLWLWFGVLILIFILLYWLFSIGMFEDLSGAING